MFLHTYIHVIVNLFMCDRKWFSWCMLCGKEMKSIGISSSLSFLYSLPSPPTPFLRSPPLIPLCLHCSFLLSLLSSPSPILCLLQAFSQEVTARQPEYDHVLAEGQNLLQLAHPRAVPVLQSKLQQLERTWVDLRGKVGEAYQSTLFVHTVKVVMWIYSDDSNIILLSTSLVLL